MHLDSIAYYMKPLCHGLPIRFKELCRETIHAANRPFFFIFLTACSIFSKKMGARSSATSGGLVFRLLRWAGGNATLR